jgi:Cu/Ag efflux pump CusA
MVFLSLPHDGPDGIAEGSIVAEMNRMRPTAVTAIAVKLPLMPLAFAIGQGSATQPPLHAAFISGPMLPLLLVPTGIAALYRVGSRAAGAAGVSTRYFAGAKHCSAAVTFGVG